MNVESNRLEQLRQLKREIRGSEEYLIVGIDIAKDTHKAFFGTPTGKTLLKVVAFENNKEGFARLLSRTEAIKVQHCLTKVVFGMEPTANYHKPLAEYLINCGHQVVERPLSTQRFLPNMVSRIQRNRTLGVVVVRRSLIVGRKR